MPRWTRKNPAVRRLEILEAAKRWFIEYGSERYSLAAIAEQADLLEKDRRGYVGLLGRVLQEAQDDGEVDSGLAGLSPATLASTLISAAHGLGRDDARFVSERIFTQRLRTLVRLSVRGLFREQWRASFAISRRAR